MYHLNICHLYPDLLNLYGDRGNIIALEKRCLWRGITVDVHNITLNDSFNPDRYDIIFLGGGQDYEQEIIQDDLLVQKGPAIKEAIENNKTFLCICGGYQLLGKYYKTWDGKEIEFLGALDLYTVGSKERMIGNVVVECDFINDINKNKVVGFENHSGKTYLGSNIKPLGRVLKGYGNNGEDGYEGARYKNVFCSYLHGSLLPKNPGLADYIIHTALSEKYGVDINLESLNDELEELAHNSILKRLIG